MSENPISISSLNDFIFCPVSIYFHTLETEDNNILLQTTSQINGSYSHRNSDNAVYSTKKSILQGVSLLEMGYTVKKIRLYSMDNNKTYDVDLPKNNPDMLDKFEKLLVDINMFSFDAFEQNNAEKCNNCIYEPLCSFSLKKGSENNAYRT